MDQDFYFCNQLYTILKFSTSFYRLQCGDGSKDRKGCFRIRIHSPKRCAMNFKCDVLEADAFPLMDRDVLEVLFPIVQFCIHCNSSLVPVWLSTLGYTSGHEFILSPSIEVNLAMHTMLYFTSICIIPKRTSDLIY